MYLEWRVSGKVQVVSTISSFSPCLVQVAPEFFDLKGVAITVQGR